MRQPFRKGVELAEAPYLQATALSGGRRADQVVGHGERQRVSTGVLTGIRAAIETPRWIASKRLGELLSLPTDARAVPRPEPERGLRAARRTLRVLSWIPGARWRTSCLYESVAECLTLRRSGVPAAVCIGVKRETGDQTGIAAHAWVARHEADTRFHGFSTLAVLDELREQR